MSASHTSRPPPHVSNAIAFYSAEAPDAVVRIVRDAEVWVETPQGVVHPAMVLPIAQRLGLSREQVVAIASGSMLLLDGEVVSLDDPRACALGVDAVSTMSCGRGLLAAGIEREWVLERVPLFGEPLVVELAEETLRSAQKKLDRYEQLRAPFTLIQSEQGAVQGVLDILHGHFSNGQPPWRTGWFPLGDHTPPPGCGPAPSITTIPHLLDSSPPRPDHLWQVVVGEDDVVTLVFPFVAIGLELASSGATILDAFKTFSARVEWSIGRTLGFAQPYPVRARGTWATGPCPEAAPRFRPFSFGEGPDVAWVVDTATGQGSNASNWAAGGSELRALTADGHYGVLVRWRGGQPRRMGRRHLIDLATGEPITTRYDQIMHRAKAVAYVDGELTVAVNGRVLRDGRRLATYGEGDLVALDATGRLFARATPSFVELADLTTGALRRVDLRPLTPLVRLDLELSRNVEASILNGIGARPLMPANVQQLREDIEGSLWQLPEPLEDGLLERVLADRAPWPRRLETTEG